MGELRWQVRSLQVLALAAALSIAVLGGPTSPGAVRADVGVIGDDGSDAFVGSGSLVLPSSMYSDGRWTAASCPGCSWRAVVECRMDTAGSCRGPARLCGADGVWLRVYMAVAGGAWIDLGAACFDSGGPVTKSHADDVVRQTIIERVPALRPSAQPSTGVLAQLPVFFGCGQDAVPLTAHASLADMSVDLTATPRWTWDFGDGRVIDTIEAGGRWPAGAVDHVYRTSGHRDVRVHATWMGTYWVDGLGPLAVEGNVTQDARVEVSVGEARSVLVG